ncbi:hypothetical protein ACJX0J_042073 [Zea mays]
MSFGAGKIPEGFLQMLILSASISALLALRFQPQHIQRPSISMLPQKFSISNPQQSITMYLVIIKGDIMDAATAVWNRKWLITNHLDNMGRSILDNFMLAVRLLGLRQIWQRAACFQLTQSEEAFFSAAVSSG